MTCEACGAEFTATRATARYCSTACRQRAHRDRVAAEAEPAGDGPLVAAVTAELVGIGHLNTASGQLAVALARGVERRPSAGLSQQLREVLAHCQFQASRARNYK